MSENPSDHAPEESSLILSSIQAASVHVPLAGDILRGADSIAEFIYANRADRRKIYNLAGTAQPPIFRLVATICARKSVLLSWIEAPEQQSAIYPQRQSRRLKRTQRSLTIPGSHIRRYERQFS